MEDFAWSGAQVEKFLTAHAGAAVGDYLGNSPDDGPDRLATEARARLDEDARGFADTHGETLAKWLSPEQAGHDLFLTRNLHGVGFWARYLPTDPAYQFSQFALENRRDPLTVAAFDADMARLTEAARGLGEVGVTWNEDDDSDDRLYLL